MCFKKTNKKKRTTGASVLLKLVCVFHLFLTGFMSLRELNKRDGILPNLSFIPAWCCPFSLNQHCFIGKFSVVVKKNVAMLARALIQDCKTLLFNIWSLLQLLCPMSEYLFTRIYINIYTKHKIWMAAFSDCLELFHLAVLMCKIADAWQNSLMEKQLQSHLVQLVMGY